MSDIDLVKRAKDEASLLWQLSARERVEPLKRLHDDDPVLWSLIKDELHRLKKKETES
jgi:hypothetical protein